MRPPLSAERVFAAARRGDPVAGRVVDTEARRLALGIATIAPVLDPEVVILGGGVGRSGDLLLEPIERELQVLSPFRPRLLVSALGDDAVLHGAVATALDAGRREVFARSSRVEGSRPPSIEGPGRGGSEGRGRKAPALIGAART